MDPQQLPQVTTAAVAQAIQQQQQSHQRPQEATATLKVELKDFSGRQEDWEDRRIEHLTKAEVTTKLEPQQIAVVLSGGRRAGAQNRVGAGSGSSGGGAGAGSPAAVQHVASMLNGLGVGQWKVPLANIRFTEHCRQTSPAAVDHIVDKIQQVGWMPTAFPQVTFPGLNDGQDMTAALATTLEAFVLDGNHRLLAAKEIFRDEPEKTITCTCYREITCPFTKKIISAACNDVSETHAKRTTYDSVFFFRTMVDEIVRARPANSPKKNVTSGELKACWKNVRGLMPSDSSLRDYLNICKTFSTLAMQSLRTMTEERVGGYERITKNFLNSDTFKDLAMKPRVQALYLQIYSREPKSRDGKIDKEAVSKQAHDVAGWLEGVERIVPEEIWSDTLKQTVKNLSYAKMGQYLHYLKPYLQRTQRELQDLELQLPQHSILEISDREIILAKPQIMIRMTLDADANLRPYLETYEGKYAKIVNDINLRKLQNVPPSKTGPGENDGKRKAGEDNDDDEEEKEQQDESDGTGEDDVEDWLLCATCNPSSTSKHCCPNSNCKVVHLGRCADTHFPEGEELSSKEHPCKNCKNAKEGAKRARAERRRHQRGDGDGEGTGKGKGRTKNKKRRTGDPLKFSAFQPLPSAKGVEDDLNIMRRTEDAFVHELMPLSPSFPDHYIGRLTLEKGQAMLIFVPLSLHEHLLQDSKAFTSHLKALVYRVCKELLHPNGTVVVSLTVPFYKHAGRIVEYLQQDGLGLVVEDCGLVVEYGSRAGGVTAESKNIGGALDYYLIAHGGNLNADGGLDFTCNMDVTPQNFPGRVTAMANVGANSSNSAKRIASPVMSDVPHKEGTRGFHDNVARFAIQRWTNQGDTVVSLNAEADGVVECALSYGRRVEAFVATEGEHAGVKIRIEDAWEAAWRQGKFSRDGSDTNVKYIAHGSLPEGIPEITTPNHILADVENANKNDNSDGPTTAKTLRINHQVSSGPGRLRCEGQ